MLIASLLFFLICIGATLLLIHDRDEIHRMVAWLSGLMAIICIFILTPLLIKGLLGMLFFVLGHKIFPTHKIFH